MQNSMKSLKIEVLLAVSGLLAGAAYFLLPLKLFVLAFGGLIGIILVLWKLEIGIVTVATLLPFLPTMAVVGLAGLIAAAYLIRLIMHKSKVKYSPLSPWVLIFAGLVMLYSVTSVTPKSSLAVALVSLSYVALYFVLINVISNKKLLYLLVVLMIASASLESLYGLYQYKMGGPDTTQGWTDVKEFSDIKTRVFGTLDNPNILAQYLEFMIPLAFGLFWYTKSIFKKIIFAGMAGVMLLCLVATYSRGGWVAFALSMIVFGIIKDRRVLALGGLAGFISIYFLPVSIIHRISTIGNLSESSNAYRTFIWASTINLIRDFWYSGVGLGVQAFGKIYNAFYIREGVYAFHAHNLYLQMFAEMGILGILSFLALVFAAFRYAIKTFMESKDEFSRTMIASLLGGLTAFLFHGVSENSFYNFKLVFMFWFTISLIMAIREIEKTERALTT